MVGPTVFGLYSETKELLKNNGIENHMFEARILTEHFLRIPPHEILLLKNSAVESETADKLKQAVRKRISGYPLQYIIGEWEFYGCPFKVGEGVLIPRQDTEALVDAVIRCSQKSSPVIADLCSGSGCIAVSLKKSIPDSEVYAIEMSDKAFEYLKENIRLNKVKVKAIMANVLENEIKNNMPYIDILVSNPPYLTEKDMRTLQKEVEFEPKEALYGGNDGIYFYNEIIRIWKDRIAENGMMFFEIGIGQQNDVRHIFDLNGFKNIREYKDLNGIIRVLSAEK